MIEVLNPHGQRSSQCEVCSSETVSDYSHMIYDGMRWSSDYPIIRFTSSEGLEVK